jgi:glycosyltransferase involved in cell wall biosynthesis
LYSLHKYAVATVVPTLFEGGFPWPALEALYMNTPVVISKIPMAIERVESVGFTADNCGLAFFEPNDYIALTDQIKYIIYNRETVIMKQKKLRQSLMNYGWDEVSREYFKIFNKVIEKSI